MAGEDQRRIQLGQLADRAAVLGRVIGEDAGRLLDPRQPGRDIVEAATERGEVAERLNAAVLKSTPFISIRAAKCWEERKRGSYRGLEAPDQINSVSKR